MNPCFVGLAAIAIHLDTSVGIDTKKLRGIPAMFARVIDMHKTHGWNDDFLEQFHWMPSTS
jgi:hypothetical protein